MAADFRRKVRPPLDDEPLDPGWRPFDADLDWSNPALSGVRWPHNREALYYWRETYWNGDPAQLPAPAAEPTGGDRLVAHLQQQVPEISAFVQSLEWQFGTPSPFACCAEAASMAVAAYRAGNADTGLRIVQAVAPALEDNSEFFAPNCVAIAFLENPSWNHPDMLPHIDRWPQAIRDEARSQQQYMADNEADTARQQAAIKELRRTAPKLPLTLVERRLFELRPSWQVEEDPQSRLSRLLFARVMSDRHWVYKHPGAALCRVWRYRHVRSPLQTLRWLVRPRFAG